jgi:hypothetical protein
MARRRFQNGRLFLRGKNPVWIGRWREDVVQADGLVRRIEKSVILGTKKQFPTKRLAQRSLDLLLARVNSPDYRAATVKDKFSTWPPTPRASVALPHFVRSWAFGSCRAIPNASRESPFARSPDRRSKAQIAHRNVSQSSRRSRTSFAMAALRHR